MYVYIVFAMRNENLATMIHVIALCIHNDFIQKYVYARASRCKHMIL